MKMAMASLFSNGLCKEVVVHDNEVLGTTV